MKKLGIVTIISDNYGNRLQNYALQSYLNNNFYFEVETILNNELTNTKKFYFFRKLKHKIFKNKNKTNSKDFITFNKNIVFSKKIMTAYNNLNDEYDYFIVGSDQIWNPLMDRLREVDYLNNIERIKRISYAASFGISKIPNKYYKIIIKKIGKYKNISVREDKGKEIIEELTGRKDVEVLVDPTMLLKAEEWDKVSKKPEQLNTDKYILNYFLGDLSEERRKEIERIAKENNCEIINIMDKNDPLYVSGPSEFLWLEKHAFLICTDSFHSSVFALLYNRPFIVFDREQEGIENMNSRIDTLINKFNLKNRRFTGKITDENLNHDYTEAYEILEKEREKSRKFLEKALDIENKE